MIAGHKNANYSRDGYKRLQRKKNDPEAMKEKFCVSPNELMRAAMMHQQGH